GNDGPLPVLVDRLDAVVAHQCGQHIVGRAVVVQVDQVLVQVVIEDHGDLTDVNTVFPGELQAGFGIFAQRGRYPHLRPTPGTGIATDRLLRGERPGRARQAHAGRLAVLELFPRPPLFGVLLVRAHLVVVEGEQSGGRVPREVNTDTRVGVDHQ